MFQSNKEYSVRMGYRALRGNMETVPWAKLVWSMEIFPRHQVLLWLAFQNKWRTKVKLKKMGLIEDESCVLCQEYRETTDHILSECEFSRAVLRWTLHAVRLSLPQSCWRQWWTKVAKGKTDLAKARRRCLAVSAYFLWQERNCRVYHISAASPKEVSGKILNFSRLGG
ncbi:hypothetical protein Dimus_038547 [Dionaea muscipula]